MKGIITYYSKQEDKGSIQSDDGKIYSFTSKDCEGDFTLSDIKEPVEATFEVSKENDAGAYLVRSKSFMKFLQESASHFQNQMTMRSLLSLSILLPKSVETQI